MRNIITTRKISGLGLIRACISSNRNIQPAALPPEKKQDLFTVPVRISAPGRGGKLLMQAGLLLKETLVIVIADERSVVVTRQLIRAGTTAIISGLKREVYTFRIYADGREISAGKLRVA